jgi:hypothetical protein
VGGRSATHCAFPSPQPSIFSHYSFLVHHPVKLEQQQLLAHAMTSDFTVTWQFSQREFNSTLHRGEGPLFQGCHTYKKSQLGYICEGLGSLGIKTVGICNDHLKHFIEI